MRSTRYLIQLLLSAFIWSGVAVFAAPQTASWGIPPVENHVSWSQDGEHLIFEMVSEGWQKTDQAPATTETADGVTFVYGLVLDQEDRRMEDDDALCLVIDINGDGESFHVLLLQEDGTLHGRRANVLDWTERWDTQAQADVHLSDEGQLTAKISVPLSDFTDKVGAGDLWRFGFGRRHPVDGKSAYPFGEADSFVWRYGSTEERRGWNRLPVPDHAYRFPATQGPVEILSHVLGACDPWYPEENAALFSLRPQGNGPRTVTLEVRDDRNRLLTEVEQTLPPGQITGLLGTYQPTPDAKTLSFLLRDDGQTLYHSVYPVRDRLPVRVWPVDGSFDPDRLAPMDPVITTYRGMTWSQLEQPQRGKTFARRYGVPWEDGQLFALSRKEGLLPWMLLDRQPGIYNDVATHIESIRRHHAKISLGTQGWEEQRAYWQGLDLYGGFPADPQQYRNTLDGIRRGLEKYKEDTAVVFFSDEPYFQMRKKAVALLAQHRKTGDYPFIEEIDREIREKFGYGIHGIPHAANDPDRLRWIALKRWSVDFVDRWERDFVKAVREINPEVPIFSSDLVGDMLSADLTRWRDGRFDIHLTQVNNHLRPNALNGVVQMRMLHDMIRPRELWACTHLENSGSSYSTREMQNLYSLYFRNGMTGLHSWPLGGTAPWMPDCQFSRPEAWSYFVQTVQQLGQGRRALVPDTATVALYMSELSQMSIPGPYDWAGFVEPAFAMLTEPGLNAEFTMISDLGVERGVFQPADHALIIAPFLPFVSAESADALLDAVEAGSTLFVSDPEAFDSLPDGTRPTAYPRAWGGVRVEPTETQMTEASSLPVDFLESAGPLHFRVPPPTLLNLLGASHRFIPDEKSRVLLRYEDGSAAAIMRPLGRGRIISVGFNIFDLTSNHPVTWDGIPEANRAFFRALLDANGARYTPDAHPVRLPDPEPLAAGDRLCITENALRFSRALPKTDYNLSVGLRYRYEPAPDRKSDHLSSDWIAAGQGPLTDRIRMLKTPDAASTVAWSSGGPIEIVIDWNGERTLTEAALFIADQRPSVRLFGSRDGTTFTLLQEQPAGEGTPAVARVGFEKVTGSWTHLKFEVQGEKPLELVEMEVWTQ